MPLNLNGIFAALTTPCDVAGEFQPEAMRANLARYAATRLAGYLVLGTSGEAAMLSLEEKRRVLRVAAPATPPGTTPGMGGKLWLAGTAEENLRDTLDLTREAAGLGYAAAVVRTPHYHKNDLSQAALVGFYRALADASPIPILAYNIPPLTGIDLGLEATLELSTHANIVGLKESSGNLVRLSHLLGRLAAKGSDFQVLVGGASTLVASLSLGARGAILALAAAAPEAPVELLQAWEAGDTERALTLQRAMLPAAQGLESGGIAALKAAVEGSGYAAGPPRPPLLPATAAQRAAIDAAFGALRPTPVSAAASEAR